MNVTSARDAVPTTVALGVENDVREAERLGLLATYANVTFDARRGHRNLWIVAAVGGGDAAALRVGDGSHDLAAPVTRTDTPDGAVFEFASAVGAMRANVAFPADDRAMVRCTTSCCPRATSQFRSGRATCTCLTLRRARSTPRSAGCAAGSCSQARAIRRRARCSISRTSRR